MLSKKRSMIHNFRINQVLSASRSPWTKKGSIDKLSMSRSEIRISRRGQNLVKISSQNSLLVVDSKSVGMIF